MNRRPAVESWLSWLDERATVGPDVDMTLIDTADDDVIA